MLEKELFAMGGITGENCGLPWKLWPPCKTGRRAKFETGDSHTVTRAGAPSFSMQNDWQLMNIVQQKQHCHQNRNISWQLHYDVIHCNRIKNLVCELLALVSMIIRQNLKDSTKSFGWVFFAIVCLLVCLLRLFVQMYVCVHILFVCFVLQSDETFVSLIKVYWNYGLLLFITIW